MFKRSLLKESDCLDNKNLNILFFLKDTDEESYLTALHLLEKSSSKEIVEGKIRDYINTIKSELGKAGYDKLGIVTKSDGSIQFSHNRFSKFIADRYDLVVFNSDTFYSYRNGYWVELDELEFKSRLRRIVNFLSEDLWKPALEFKYIEALKLECKRIKEFNSRRNYVNLTNGMLNLKTFELESHHKYYYSSIQIPIEYEKESNCPKFKDFLMDIFDGDQERVLVMQEILGYCLTADTNAQKAFILLGHGSNGKSVLCDVMAKLYGEDNLSSTSLKELGGKFAKFSIYNKTVNISTENEMDRDMLATGDFKKIVSGDLIQVEEKYRNPFIYRPFVKLIFAVNSMPKSMDYSYGYYRRLLILPFNKRYSLKPKEGEELANPNLKEKLFTEMPGILNFALEGLKRLRDNNYKFTESREIDTTLRDYRKDMDILSQFIEDEVQEETHFTVQRYEIRNRFESWCIRTYNTKHNRIPSREFWKRFRNSLNSLDMKYNEGKSNGKDLFIGIRLKSDRKK